MSQRKNCTKGSNCEFLKAGTCKFAHKADPKAGSVTQRKKPAASKDKVKREIPHVRFVQMLKHATPVLKMIADAKQKTAIISDYVKVNGPDAKTPVVDPDVQAISLFRTAARAAIGGQHIRTKLFYNSLLTGGAGAAIAGFYALQPSATGEYSIYSGLYDECRATGVVLRYLASSLNSTGSTNTQSAYAVAYDPDYGITPAGVNDLMDSEHVNMHFLACQLGTFGNAPSVCPIDKHVLTAKIRPNTVLNVDMKANPNLPGSWVNCNDAAGAAATFSVGYARFYVTPTGGTSVVQLFLYQELQMEFRIRQ